MVMQKQGTLFLDFLVCGMRYTGRQEHNIGAQHRDTCLAAILRNVKNAKWLTVRQPVTLFFCKEMEDTRKGQQNVSIRNVHGILAKCQLSRFSPLIVLKVTNWSFSAIIQGNVTWPSMVLLLLNCKRLSVWSGKQIELYPPPPSKPATGRDNVSLFKHLTIFIDFHWYLFSVSKFANP